MREHPRGVPPALRRAGRAAVAAALRLHQGVEAAPAARPRPHGPARRDRDRPGPGAQPEELPPDPGGAEPPAGPGHRGLLPPGAGHAHPPAQGDRPHRPALSPGPGGPSRLHAARERRPAPVGRRLRLAVRRHLRARGVERRRPAPRGPDHGLQQKDLEKLAGEPVENLAIPRTPEEVARGRELEAAAGSGSRSTPSSSRRRTGRRSSITRWTRPELRGRSRRRTQRAAAQVRCPPGTSRAAPP